MNNIVTVSHELKEDDVFCKFEKTNKPSRDVTVNWVRTLTMPVSDYVHLLLNWNNWEAECRILLDTSKKVKDILDIEK